MSKIGRWTCGSNAGAIARLLGASLLTATTSPAVADPCCAPLPPPGGSFSGVVRYVGDGDSLCVGPASHPERWIEVRLGYFNAPESQDRGGPAAKTLLKRVAAGKRLVCVAEHRSYDRVVAQCTLRGRRLGDLLRAAGGAEGGR